MKSFRIPLILVVTLGILTAVAYWDEWKNKKDDLAEKQKNHLFTFAVTDVVGVSYVNSSKASGSAKVDNNSPSEIEIKFTNEKWQIEKPVVAMADQEAIHNFIENLTQLKFEKKLSSDPARWPEFGLDKPEVEIKLIGRDGKKWQLAIGRKAPVGYSVYVRINDDQDIYLASQYISVAATKTLYDFRDKKLFPSTLESLNQLEYLGAENVPVILEKKSNEWVMTRPQQAKADFTVISDFINGLRETGVEEFIDNPSDSLQKALALNNPAVKFLTKLAWTSQQERSEVIVVENNGEVYSYRDPKVQIQRIGKNKSKAFIRTVKDFREQRIFNFNSQDVVHVTIDGKKYLRDKDEWFLEEGGKNVPGDAKIHVRYFIVDLELAKADETQTFSESLQKKLGPSTHLVVIKFKDELKKEPITINLWGDLDKEGTIWLTGDQKSVHRIANQVVYNLNEESFLKHKKDDGMAPMDEDGEHSLHGS